jgi:hypothetical protein
MTETGKEEEAIGKCHKSLWELVIVIIIISLVMILMVMPWLEESIQNRTEIRQKIAEFHPEISITNELVTHIMAIGKHPGISIETAIERSVGKQSIHGKVLEKHSFLDPSSYKTTYFLYILGTNQPIKPLEVDKSVFDSYRIGETYPK